jgi:ubiquinone/menaquinone biosynthesis C-methylase UbiE
MGNHSVCPSWLSFSLVNEVRKTIHNPQKMFKNYIRPGNFVADIGCGPGYFSIPMSYMVGPEGKIISVDIQAKMIEKLQKRLREQNLEKRFNTIVCQENNIGIKEKVDFVLTFWMVHEVKNVDLFFQQIKEILKEDGKYLLVEPKIHVSSKEYSRTLKKAEQNGLKVKTDVKIKFSRASILYK